MDAHTVVATTAKEAVMKVASTPVQEDADRIAWVIAKATVWVDATLHVREVAKHHVKAVVKNHV